MNEWYRLDGRKAVRCSMLEPFEMDKDSKRVGFNQINGVDVSTIFLGLDHAWGNGPPLLFETMVFGGALDQEQDRCSTWEQAETMHALMCDRVRKLSTQPPANPHGTVPNSDNGEVNVAGR